ncbi:MAG: hypothetical protein HQL30_11120 [Candidatus Omnitrophica bacterium]|nr:hypothetical protein [Candidatus Omnitrophota bacterium]
MNSNKCNVEVFSRVTGFFRPVQTWNEGKTAEFGDRMKYDAEAFVETNEDSRTAKTVSC